VVWFAPAPLERGPMSSKVEGRSEELLKAKNFCDVATLRSDGSVHAVPVWVDCRRAVPC
jgi:hypothetical protein